MAYENDRKCRNSERKKRITKKMASEICKKVVGTDKGLFKIQDSSVERWELRIGMINVNLAYESIYDTFSQRVDGKYIEVRVTVNNSDGAYLFFDPESLGIDSEYTDQWNRENRERYTNFDESGT